MPLVNFQIVSGFSNVICYFLESAAPADYTATTATFTFSGTQNRDCVNVPINEDNILEVRETFSGNLDTSAPRVTLQPDVTVITITDVGGKSPNLSSPSNPYLE